MTTGAWKVCSSPACPHAGIPQPWDAFYAQAKWPDGTMRYPQSRCKPCHVLAANAATKARRAENPEPFRARERSLYTPRPRKRRRKTAPSVDRILPVAPFAAWLQARVVETGSVSACARDLGLWDTTVRLAVRGESRFVRETTLDRAVTAWGDPAIMEDLYPLAA